MREAGGIARAAACWNAKRAVYVEGLVARILVIRFFSAVLRECPRTFSGLKR